MGSPNQDGGPETRAGPPTRRRRLDFSNMHESSPALAFATGDSPYSKLDMLAAAASEAAGQAQTPAASDHSHEPIPSAAHGARHIPHVPAGQGGPKEAADGYYTPRQTSTDGVLPHRGPEDEGDALNSPGGRRLPAAAQRNKRARELENEVPNGPAIDLQKREVLNTANRTAAQIGAAGDGRDLQHSSASLVRCALVDTSLNLPPLFPGTASLHMAPALSPYSCGESILGGTVYAGVRPTRHRGRRRPAGTPVHLCRVRPGGATA